MGKVGDFNGGKGLDRQVGVKGPHRTDHFFKPGQRPGGVAAAHNVQLVEVQGRCVCRAQAGEHIVEAHGKCARFVLCIAAKGAKRAAVDAHVGIVDLPVDHIKGLVTVQAAAHVQRKRAHGGDIGTIEQGKPVFGRKPLPGEYLFADRRKAQCGVVCCVEHI